MSRRWVPFLLCLAMALVPLLALGGTHGGTSTSVYAGANLLGGRGADGRASRSASLRSFDLPLGGLGGASVADATPTTAPPAAVVAADATEVPAAPPRTTVTRRTTPQPVRPTVHRVAPPPPPVASRPSQTGPASWYGAPAGTCAHPSLPLGTLVTVTDLSNGRTTTCRVEDRGPYQGGRIIDLSEATFAQLAPPASGVIEVRITW